MKKSLIALAVLAASGTAMAQSSVTLYGVADVWVGSVKNEGIYSDTGAAVRQTQMVSGGISTSRIGFKGTEDLGGGLKAGFVLEQGIDLTSGTTLGSGFNREASIGLSGGFGEVKIGKVWNAFDDVSAGAASTFDSDLSPINTVFVSTLFATNPNSGIRYTTPNFGGFSGAVSFTVPGDKTATTSASKFPSVSAQYANGPIFVGFGYAQADGNYLADFNELATDFGLPAATKAKGTRLNGSYDLGVAKLLATYGNVKLDGTDLKANEFEFGVDVPLTSALTLSGGYAQSKIKVGGVTGAKTTGFGLAAAYSLSKRTTAYAGLNNTKTDDGAGDEAGKSTVYAVGIKHAF